MVNASNNGNWNNHFVINTRKQKYFNTRAGLTIFAFNRCDNIYLEQK